MPKEQINLFLMIECPRILFPFARRIVSDISRDGGYPPINLDMIDFLKLYQSKMAQKNNKLLFPTIFCFKTFYKFL